VKENKESFEIFIYLFMEQMGKKNPLQKGNVNTLVFQACPIVLIVIVHLGCIIIIIISYYLCSHPPSHKHIMTSFNCSQSWIVWAWNLIDWQQAQRATGDKIKM
jgi:hypothetical protein